MSEISVFLQNAWRLLWKSKILWFFSALYSAITLLNYQEWGMSGICVYIGGFILSLICLTGLSYISYCLALGVTTGMTDTWNAIKKYIGRVSIVFCLGLIPLLVPLICMFSAYLASTNSVGFIIRLVIMAFTSILSLAYAGIIVMNFGVGKSLRNGWAIFTLHFWTLSAMGILFAAIWWSMHLIAVTSILLVQAKFDFSVLNRVNYLNPMMTLTTAGLVGVSPVIQLIWQPLATTAFMLAYLKYNDIKAVGHSRFS